MEDHIEHIMQNRMAMSDSENYIVGGNVNLKIVPTGLFPPIYLCTQTDGTVSDTKRTYATVAKAVSLKEIMSTRRTM